MATPRSRMPIEEGSSIVEMGSRRMDSGGAITAVASALALLFSAYSLYETSVRRPDLRAFVPPVIRYSSPYNNSNFEVFEVPVTLVNLGARAGTIMSMDLKVENPRRKETKLFYSADFGRWTMDNANALAFQPFAPISLQGKSSTSQSVLFYARSDEKVQQVADEQGTYKFKLTLNTVYPEDLGFMDKLWLTTPTPVTFEMEMPEIDNRVFTRGTLPLHAPGWHVNEPGTSTTADSKPDTESTGTTTGKSDGNAPATAEATPEKADSAANHPECKDHPGTTITSAGFDLKTGKATSSEFTCPGTPDAKAN